MNAGGINAGGVMVTKGKAILIVTANESLAQSLQKTFSDSGYRSLVATDESAALSEMGQTVPPLILVDRQQGKALRLRQNPMLRSVPFIALWQLKSDCGQEDCADDLEEGFDDAICEQSPRQIVARIRAILRRQQYESPSRTLYSVGGIRMNLEKHEVTVQGRPVELTPKEFQILKYFLESPNRVFTRQEMLNCVWGEGYALEEHALDVHIHSLRQKIELEPARPTFIVTVRGVGYKLRTG